MSTIQTLFSLTRVDDDGNLVEGNWPSEVIDVSTTSDLFDGSRIQSVGTTAAGELLDAGDISDPAVAVFKNKHASATVQVGVQVGGTFYPLFEIPAGEKAFVARLPTLANVYLKSDTASTPVSIALHTVAS